MIELDQLVDHALGQLRERDVDLVEAHLLSCGACSATFERLLSIGPTLRALVTRGALPLAIDDRLREKLDQAGLVSRTYTLLPDRSVNCSVGASDVYVLTALRADLRGVERVDAVHTFPTGTHRTNDVPFDAALGLVQFVAPGDFLRTVPTGRVHLQLIAVAPSGERKLGDYYLEHTAFVSS